MSYQAEVRTGSDPKFYANDVRFATWIEAEGYGQDLAYRWTAVKEMRVAESGKEPNYTWIHNNLVLISNHGYIKEEKS
jgi:hypothetical protein